MLSRAEQDRVRYRERSGESGAVPADRLAGRLGARQSPAQAGPVPAGNPSPARPDWKSPAGCAGWAGPGPLSLTVMRRQIWAGAGPGPRRAAQQPRSRLASHRGIPLRLPGSESLGTGSGWRANAGRDRLRGAGPTWYGTCPVLRDRPRWEVPNSRAGNDHGRRSPLRDPASTRWSGAGCDP